jgi:hypothetical protein
VRAAGHRAVALYVGTPGRAKSPSRDQVQAYLDAGLELILVYEDTSTSWQAGRPRGISDAIAVQSHLKVLGLDWSKVGCVYHAIDSDVTPAHLPAAADYLSGVASVYGGTDKLGVYGSRAVITAALNAGQARLAWAAAGWQYGAIDPRSALHQQVQTVTVGGVQCDVNQLLADDYGKYPRLAAAPAPAPAPAAVSVPRSPEDAVALLSFPATPLPVDPPGGRWQDTNPATWVRSAEQRTALVPAVKGGWRGAGSISSLTCGWAGNQDGPDAQGRIKPSGFIEYLRIFGWTDISYKTPRAVELVTNRPMTGNFSLPQLALPDWCTFLVVRYSAPGGLYLGIEWEH